MTDKTKKIIARAILIIFLFLFVHAPIAYSWEQEELDNLTVEFKKYDSAWDYWKTIDLLTRASHSAYYVGGIGRVAVTITGKTIILNGKDITGNLGSKTTYGDNSPIIDKIQDSKVAIGEKPVVSVDNKKVETNIVVKILTNITYSISITIALTLSIAYNIIVGIKRKKK